MSTVTFRRPDGRDGTYAQWTAEVATRWAALSDTEQAASRAKAAARFASQIRAQDAGQPTLLHLYDEIGWFGICPADIVEALAGITGDVEVHVNSPGGSIFDGLAIFAALKQHAGQVGVVVDGLAASAASFIAMAASPGKLAMTPNGTVMIHEGWGMCVGDAAEMASMAAVLDKSSDNIASIYAARSGRTADYFRGLMKDETWAVGAEAVDLGLADTVLADDPAPAPDASASLGRWHVTIAAAAAAPVSLPPAPAARGPAADAGDCCPLCGPDCECSTGPDDRAARPAGRAARVLGIESMPLADEALPVHHTATVDEAWDGPAAVAAMPNNAKVLKYCHAWQDTASDDGSTADDPDGDADDKKSNYKFPHHKTEGGPANLAACRNGLARLPGASIPDGDRAGVKAHLQAHLDDASKDDAGNHARQHLNLSGIDLGELATGLKGALA